MAVKYEKIVEEDLNLGIGTVDVTMPGGGTAVGHRIGPQSFTAVGFVATAPGTQAITGGAAAAVVQFTTEEFDIASWFNTSTFKFIPDVAGRYHIDAALVLAAFTGTVTVGVYKNSTAVIEVEAVRTAAVAKVALSALVTLNGDTDEITLRVSHNDGVNNRTVTSARLSGYIVGRNPS